MFQNHGNHRHLIAALALVGSTLVAAAPAACIQDSPRTLRVLPDRVTVRVSELLSIGDREGPGYVGRPTGLSRAPNGNWLVTHAQRPGSITVFDSLGHYVRIIGRTGEGPAEFRNAAYVNAAVDDSVRVFDVRLLRMTVLGPDMHVARVFPVESPVLLSNVLWLNGDRFIGAGSFRTSERAGLPFHLYDGLGHILRSFGADEARYRYDQRQLLTRTLAIAGPNSVWSGHRLEYRIELWNIDGRKARDFVRNVDWFPPQRTIPSRLSADSPPRSGMSSIFVDRRTGYVIVLIRVADPRWAAAVSTNGHPSGLPIRNIGDRRKYWDTLVEVIDAEEGAVVGSGRSDAVLEFFTPEGFAVEYVEDSEGYPALVVWDVQIADAR